MASRSCIALLVVFLSSAAAHPPSNLLHHPELGYALVLPLSRHSRNHTLGRSESILRSRHLVSNSQANARMALYDDLLTTGYHSARLWIGSPPQEFALIVDTGSTLTFVPCLSCTECGVHQDPRFNPEASSTYKPEECGPSCPICDSERHQCMYSLRYLEGSASKGVLGNDVVLFGNVSSLGPQRLVFGCETAESGAIFQQKADGIMGLGDGPDSIVDQLVTHNAMSAAFSLCYGGMDGGAGAMIMGAIPSPPHMVFTNLVSGRSPFYNVDLQQVIVSGTPLPVDQSVFNSSLGTVLDSGTTYAYFPDKAFEALTAALSKHVKLGRIAGPDPSYPDICYEGAGSDLSKLSNHFPEVQLKFGDGKIVSLAPENYLFKHLKAPGSYCLGILPNGPDSITLLGGVVVQNMLVTYDRVNKQIGFWRTNCSDLWSSLQAATGADSAAALAPAPDSIPQKSSPNATAGTMVVSGTIDVVISLNAKFEDIDSFKFAFLHSMSEELHVNKSQLSVLNISWTGSNVTAVTFRVQITAKNQDQLDTLAQHTIAQLKNEEGRPDHIFGKYQVRHWTIVPEKKKGS